MVHGGRGQGVRLHRPGHRAGRRRERPGGELSVTAGPAPGPPAGATPGAPAGAGGDTAARAAAEARVESVAPGYLARARAAAARLSVRAGVSGDVDVALDDVRERARVDTDVPTLSRRRSVHLLKVAVKALVGWYVRYLGQQVQALGESVSQLGEALVARTEGVEEKVGSLDDEVADLRRRLAALEAGAERDPLPTPPP